MGIKKCKKYLPSAAAIFVMVGISGVFFIFPGIYIANTLSPFIVGYIGLVFVFVLVNYFMTCFTDPGIYPKRLEPEDDEDELRAPVYVTVLIHDVTVRMKWCSTCKFYRPPRVSHCSMCNNCIDKFDHHCPWVGNCVGRRNYQYFFGFLLLLVLHILNVQGFSLYVILSTNGATEFKATFYVSITIIVIVGIISFLVFGLFGFHIYLVSNGRTTNEQVTGKFRSGVNPFDHGCVGNCFNAFCSLQLPKYIERADAVDYSKYKIKTPYIYPQDSITVQNVVTFESETVENGKNSSTEQHSIVLSSRNQSDVTITAIKDENTCNVPEVKIIPRNGSIRQELDPDRFRAKVTPIVSNQNCELGDAVSYACMEIATLNSDSDSDHENGEYPPRPGSGVSTNSATKLMDCPQNDDKENNDSALFPQTHDSIQFLPSKDVKYLAYRDSSSENLPTVSSAHFTEVEDTTTMPNVSDGQPSIIDSSTNANNCNNHTLEVCESGYSSHYASSEPPAEHDDITNKLKLELAMRDIEANVALLRDSRENLESNSVSSQKGDCVVDNVQAECS